MQSACPVVPPVFAFVFSDGAILFMLHGFLLLFFDWSLEALLNCIIVFLLQMYQKYGLCLILHGLSIACDSFC